MKKITIFFLVLFSIQFSFAQTTDSLQTNCTYFVPDLIPILVGKKYAYCDKSKKIIIPAKFDKAEPFANVHCELNGSPEAELVNSSNFATVTIGNNKHRIDKTGKIVFTFKDEDGACDYVMQKSDYEPFKENELWGVKLNNTIIIPAQYNEIRAWEYPFEPPFVVIKNNKFGLVDDKNNILLATKYDEFIFNNTTLDYGILVKVKLNNKIFFVDFCGNEYVK